MDTSTMATEEPQQVQIDMSAFMDVIYTYKCKFCPFTCASSEEMSSHAMSTHVPENVRLQAVGSTDQEKTDTSNITSHDNQSTIIAVEEQESVAVVQETQTEESTDHHQYTEEQVEQNEIIADSEAVASQSEGVQSTASDGGDLRELFLCGQCCNVGFTSIEECRAHMLQEHDIHPSAAELKTEHVETEAPAEVAVSSNMVSVGTQSIIHKKPGRKRKSEIREEPEPDDKDSEEAEFNMDAPISIFNMRDTEGTDKRRVKPPKALMEDYYLGRRKHKKRRQPREPYDIKCKVSGCHAKFKTEDSKIIHLSCHLDIKDQKPGQNFKCLKCDSYFLNWKLTAKHLWKEHSIDADLFKCFHCEFRAETLQRLETHEQVHSDQKPYVCKTCGKGFKQLAQLKNHEVIHTTKKVNSAVGVEKWFNSKVCNICDKTFANQKCMKKHVEAVHDKLKPFKCQFCGHTTARKAMLLLHIRTHTGEKPYKCDLCTYVTGDHNTLRRHRMRHTGQKPYKCQICPYSCIQAISLKTHLKNKHPGCEGIFACELCQYHTVSQLNWEQHQADHRTGAIPDGYSSKREKTVASTTVAVSAQAVNTIANAKSLQSVLSLATGVGTQVLYYDPVTQQISAGGVPNQENTIVMADEATKQLMASSATPVTEASAQEETTIIEQAPGGSYTVSTGQEHEVLLTVQGDPHIEQTTTILPEGSIIYTQEPEQEGQQTFTIKEHHVLGQGDQMVTSGSEGAGLQHILTAIQNMSQEETVAIEGSTVEQTDGTALEIATEEVDESVNQDQLIEIEIK